MAKHLIGFADNPDFSIEVYLVEGDMDWYNWFKSLTPKSEGGDGVGLDGRKGGKLTAYNSSDEVVLEWDDYQCLAKKL
jgi:hypothetical protein